MGTHIFLLSIEVIICTEYFSTEKMHMLLPGKRSFVPRAASFQIAAVFNMNSSVGMPLNRKKPLHALLYLSYENYF